MKKVALSLFLLSSFVFADNHQASSGNHDASHGSAKPAEVKTQAAVIPVKKAAATTTTKKKAPTGENAQAKPTEGSN